MWIDDVRIVGFTSLFGRQLPKHLIRPWGALRASAIYETKKLILLYVVRTSTLSSLAMFKKHIKVIQTVAIVNCIAVFLSLVKSNT